MSTSARTKPRGSKDSRVDTQTSLLSQLRSSPAAGAVLAVTVAVLAVVLALTAHARVQAASGLDVHAWRRVPQHWQACAGSQLYEQDACREQCAAAALASSLRNTADIEHAYPLSRDVSCHGCRGFGTRRNAMWAWLEANVPDANAWTNVLDAGTGPTSYQWLSRVQGVQNITAVTADAGMARRVAALPGFLVRPQDRLITGSWRFEDTSPLQEQLETRQFTLILADYLVGSMDAFSPFVQDTVFTTLRRYLAPGGVLAITGQQPYAMRDEAQAGPREHASDVARAIFQLRDAAQVAIGLRYYREFPLDWYSRQLQRAGFRVLAAQRFPVAWSAASLAEQLDVITSRVKEAMHVYPDRMMGDTGATQRLYASLLDSAHQLRTRLHASAHISHVDVCHVYDFAILAVLDGRPRA